MLSFAREIADGAFVGLREHKDCSDFAIKVDLQLAMLRRENDLVDEGADGFEGLLLVILAFKERSQFVDFLSVGRSGL
ncbi:hypothetical protein [Methyloceanibacter sp.]|uniref:hypothetical protein n=1 Tax=Methyloceanibacter sp. TaxID=1965321 RepID=UPI003C7365DC